MEDIFIIIKILASIIFIVLLFIVFIIISEKCEEDMERSWKILKYEYIISLFINIVLEVVNSIKIQTLYNLSTLITIALVIFFGISGFIWNGYKRTRLPLEKCLLFSSVSDGNGSRIGYKEGTSALFVFNATFAIFLTASNIFYLIFGNRNL